ncbi:hypothetical protein JCM10207_004954 [Rhodosporidiobolus poonsookiae]
MAADGAPPDAAGSADNPAPTGGNSTASLPHPDCFIRFRLSHIDYYLAHTTEAAQFDNPRSPFSKDPLRVVPVIRIFGATDRGARVLAHIHGAFPYVYIKYEGKLDPESVNSYILQLGAALNQAMELSFADRKKNGKKPASPQYVAFIVLCKGVEFYGYHVGYTPCLKIYTVNPKYQKRLAEILRSGAVSPGGKPQRVYEDHIPFLLQFMLDTNLYGCGWVEAGKCLFREEVPEHHDQPSDEYNPPSCDGPFAFRTYTTRTVPESRMHPHPDYGGPLKLSYEALEIDLPISAVLNRSRLTGRNLHHDFVERLQPEMIVQGRSVASVKELWTDERLRRLARGEEGPYDLKDTAPRAYDSRPPDAPHFKVEPKLRAEMDKRFAGDLRAFQEWAGARGKQVPDFETFVDDQAKMNGGKSRWLDSIRTLFEQVDAVFVERFEEEERSSYPFGAWAVKGIGLHVSREQEAMWGGASSSIRVDVAKLRSSQAAHKASRVMARRRADTEREFADEVGEEYDEDEDAEDDSDDDDGGGFGARRAPPTQQDAMARSQRAMDRAERRGREDTWEGEWDHDVDDDDDDAYWGINAGTDRPASEASFGTNDEAASSVGSPGSRKSSVSPGKRVLDTPTKLHRAAGEQGPEEYSPETPSKRLREDDGPEVVQSMAAQGGAFGQQAASFLSSPAHEFGPSRRQSRSPTFAQTPSHAASSAAFTPSRRLRNNPFSSPDKAVAVRLASTRPAPRLPPTLADEAEESPALFTFEAPVVKAEEATNPFDVKSSTFAADAHARSHSPPPPLEHYLAASPEPNSLEARSPRRFLAEMTPSQALAELDDLEDGAFEDDYQPTPTIKEELPSQIPQHLRSSPASRFPDSDSEDEEMKPVAQVEPSSTPPDQLVEPITRLTGGKAIVLPSPPPKKHVAFQLGRTNSDMSSTSTSQTTTPTPVGPSSGAAKERPAERTSQSTEESDAAPAPPPRRTAYASSRRSFVFAEPPPSSDHLLKSIESFGQSSVVYQEPFYSKRSDVPNKVREYGGKRFLVQGKTLEFLPPFQHDGDPEPVVRKGGRPMPPKARKINTWEFAERPPSLGEAKEWLNEKGLAAVASKPRFDPLKSQIEAPTQKADTSKFQSTKNASTPREKQHMAVLSVEVLVNTRVNENNPTKHFLPNPHEDAVEAVFYCLQTDNEDVEINGRNENTHVGVIAVGDERVLRRKLGNPDYIIEAVDNEHDLFVLLVEKVRYEWDPECLAGYEVHHSSWGYLLERCHYAHEWNLVPELGRVKSFDTGKFGDAKSDRWGFNQSSTLNFTGRHVLPIWRILKADNKFQQNSFEHIAYHVLKQRTPHLSFKTLTEWYKSDDPAKFSRVFEYWRNRTEMNIEMIDAAEVIDQNCESARVFGVDFNSVRTRGSQFKVEAVMFKITKPESFLLLSPNRQQVGKQNAAECMPLIQEPESAFYKGPLVVVDFQSLYPSVMIAYNLCYSTCLGRVSDFKGEWKFGVSETELPDGLLHLLKDDITISPNGMLFVKPHIRKSALAKMLADLLDTRVMVKASMKGLNDKGLLKLLNARQLALKFLANVTYGYTSATFSGRMPAVEIADAIVQTGRETLEKAREIVHANKAWGAKVVYGDTDSLFIYLPGKSKEDAFRIGYEIADTVTAANPRPIKLKFEKVYLPCVLLAKKRYVGFKYETLNQKEPDLDAKGIETIRRDGIPATQKIQEWCLKDFFRHRDVSRIKEFCQRQWKKLQAGDVSPQDFIIAKKVRLGSYAEGRAPPPGAAVAAREMLLDPRAEPEYGERVPYVMFQAAPGQLQIHRALDPLSFLKDSRLRLDAAHYIERMMLGPLERIFLLMGVDPRSWYRDMAKTKRVHKVKAGTGLKPVMLEEHFKSDRCPACNGSNGTASPVCPDCRAHPAEAVYALEARKQALLSKRAALHEICVSCSGNPRFEPIACDSFDCPNLWARARNTNELAKVVDARDLEW